MAFSTLNTTQQELNRKILEDLQFKKQLLQKGVVTPVISSINTPATNNSNSPEPTVNVPARVAWNQANSLSFGFFVPQDSHLGNNIIPVLPRFDNPPK